MKLYIAVTNDQYELPVYIEDTLIGLARKLGVHKTTIFRQLRGDSKEFKDARYKIVRVEVEDDSVERRRR